MVRGRKDWRPGIGPINPDDFQGYTAAANRGAARLFEEFAEDPELRADTIEYMGLQDRIYELARRYRRFPRSSGLLDTASRESAADILGMILVERGWTDKQAGEWAYVFWENVY